VAVAYLFDGVCGKQTSGVNSATILGGKNSRHNLAYPIVVGRRTPPGTRVALTVGETTILTAAQAKYIGVGNLYDAMAAFSIRHR
jgi:hypothetical protein